jgi:curli biogenesis system outer membrane secretion channel CsgG
MTTIYRLLGWSLTAAALVSGCATTPTPAPALVPATLIQLAPALPAGPKKRVAVIRFENVSKFAEQYGAWDLGGGLAAQLTTALVECGHFVVVERAALADVLREQEMAMEKVVSKESATKVGQLLGAQLLVKGSVTEFEQAAGGGGLKIGIGLPIPGLGIGGAGNVVQAHVGIDLRLIDTASGEVIRSVRAEGKASKTGVAVGIDVHNVSFGGDAFKVTPLGIATREAIERAVHAIEFQMDRVPWTGRVMDVMADRVYINAGQDANIKVGNVFTVTQVLRELRDPDTGMVRGVIENRLGQVEIESVEEKFAVGAMRGGAPLPKRGDLLKQALN